MSLFCTGGFYERSNHTMFRNSVRTAKKNFFITKINWLMLFNEIIDVYSKNHTKPTNTLCGQNADLLIINLGGTNSYHWALKG
jgi:hypothetical protein